MAKSLDPKCKQCRREGVKLLLKGDRCNSSKCSFNKRNYPPGLHGAKGRPKLTSFGMQLRAKQKAKRVYGLLEDQFRISYEKAFQKNGETAENLLHILESRADNIVYRAGFAKSRFLARELVAHGHFLINGKKTKTPSYQLKINDVIEVKEKSKESVYFQSIAESLEKYQVPDWLSMDPKEMKAKYLALPTIEQVLPIFDLKNIVEFYSR